MLPTRCPSGVKDLPGNGRSSSSTISYSWQTSGATLDRFSEEAATTSFQLQVLDPRRPPGDLPILDLVGEDALGHQNLVIDLTEIEDAELVLQIVDRLIDEILISLAMRSEYQISNPPGSIPNLISPIAAWRILQEFLTTSRVMRGSKPSIS